MRFLRELFSESSSISMVRVMSLLSLLIGAKLALEGKDASVSIFVLAAFSGKVAQKALEIRNKN